MLVYMYIKIYMYNIQKGNNLTEYTSCYKPKACRFIIYNSRSSGFNKWGGTMDTYQCRTRMFFYYFLLPFVNF